MASSGSNLLWVILAVVIGRNLATIDHTVAYRLCANDTEFSSAGSCTYYTTVYYDGEFVSTGTTTDDVITLVGTADVPARAGNSATCGEGVSCTITTPTTIEINSSPNTVYQYTLSSLGFKIPWQYFFSTSVKPLPSSPPDTGATCPADRGFMNVFTTEPQTPANTGAFGEVGSFCMSEAEYTQSSGPYSDHPGPPFPPSSYPLGDFVNNTAFRASCDRNRCPRTSQYTYGVTTYPVTSNCCCSFKAGSTCVDGVGATTTSTEFFVQEIFPYTGPPNTPAFENGGVCEIYSISSPTTSADDYVTVTVSSALGTETTSYQIDSGVPVVVPASPDEGEIVVTGLGTDGMRTPGVNAYEIPSGSLLIQCTPYTGGRSDPSLPTMCDPADDYADTNYIFYVPPHYASGYNSNNGYGASANFITVHALGGAVTPDQCFDFGYMSEFVPGYPVSDGLLYDRTEGACGQQSLTTPIFDAQQLCYKSVSPATMYDAIANGLDQWRLPGTFQDTVSYSTEWDDPQSGGVLIQTIPPTATTPPTAYSYAYSLSIDIADTLMDYLDPIEVQTASIDNTNTLCSYITAGQKTGQYKVTVCNKGMGDNSQVSRQYNVTSACMDGLSVTANSTVITNKLTQGTCESILIPLAYNAADLVPVNDTELDTSSAGTGGGATLPPKCESSVVLVSSIPGAPVLTTESNCIRIPSVSSGSGSKYILIGVIVGIVVVLGGIGLLLWKCKDGGKPDAKKKKKD